MKLRFKKNMLTILIITSLSSPVYAETIRSNQSTVTVNTDGSLTIPSYGGNIKEFINEKIEDLKNDANMQKFIVDKEFINKKIKNLEDDVNIQKYTVDKDSIDDYIPVEHENTLVKVEDLSDVIQHIYGGKIEDNDVMNTNVLFISGNARDIFGANSVYGNVSGNVFITGGNIKRDVKGAYSDNGKATGNVFITDGTVGEFVYGAQSYREAAEGNAFITGGTIQNSVYGAYSENKNATGNAFITGGTINDSVYGAYSSDGSAKGNAFITGGAISDFVFGANSVYGNAEGNVFITGGTVGRVRGAYSEENGKNVTGNVYISGGTVNYEVSGAYNKYSDSYTGNIVGNVYITGGTINGEISGASNNYGDSYIGNIVGNVYITGGTIDAQVSGASNYVNSSGNIEGNVYITGGTIDGPVYGTLNNSYISGNKVGNVYITGGTINGTVSGISSMDPRKSMLVGNVYLSGDVTFNKDSDIYGWSSYEDDDVERINKGLLSIASTPLTVAGVGNFTQYDFYLNESNKTTIGNLDKALLTVNKYFDNKDKSNVRLVGISKEGMVSNGSKIILINADGASFSNDGSFSDLFETKDGDTSTVQVGSIGKADVIYGVDDVKQQITATIDNYQVDEDRANKNLKPISEGRLATLQNAVRGAEALQDVMGEHKQAGTFTPIAEISGGINQYSGSTSIESRDYRLIVGSRYQILNNLYTGVAFDYGRSNYNSDNGDKTGEGNTYNYGASLFSKYTNSLALGDLYFDGALRFGKTSTEMKSNDVITNSNEFVSYKSKVNYFGTNTGLGFIYNLNKISSFDTSAHYFWTHLSGDNITIDGDDIHFKAANSSKIQFKEQYNYKTTDNLTFTLAGIYEYEFDSKAGASVLDVSIDAPSIKGSTRIVELGVKGTPIAENKDFNFNLRFRGYTGKRNGASASAFFEYDF